jgi:hypothetical protein
MIRLVPRSLAGALAVLAAAAGPAGASVAVSSFSLTPSTTQAGAGPDLTLDLRLAAAGADTVKDLTLSLPPGLWASPAAAQSCPAASFESDACPAASLVGQGTTTATATFLFFPVTMTSPTQAFLVEPRDAGEVARLGLVISSLAGTIRAEGPIRLRTSPDVGADIAFSDLPNRVLGLPVSIEALNLTLSGQAAGGQFTRNPTSCEPATTRLQATSYAAPASAAAAESRFTPTGCDALAYAPALTAAGALGAEPGDDLALTVGAGQPAGQVAHRRIKLTLPEGIFGRVSTLLDACAAADAAACAASATVGSATVTTPLLDRALAGRLVLARRASGLPGLTAVFPAPFPLRLEGTTTLSGGRFVETLDGIPDVPISGLEVRFDGGSRSLFEPFPALCDGGAVLDGEFTGHNGAARQVSAPVSLTGCRPRPARAGGLLEGVAEAVGAVKATARLTLRGLGGRAPRVALTVKVPRDAAGLKVVDVRLPRGLRVVPVASAAGVRGLFDGRPRAGTTAGRSRSIRATALSDAGAHAIAVILRRPQLRVDRALARRIRTGRAVALTVHAVVKDTAGRTSTLAVRARSR